MSKKQFNSLPNFSVQQNVNVDADNGILKNVEIAKFGKNKNDSYFSEQFLNDLVAEGNASKNGIKSRFGHPNMCATSLGTFIGRFKEFELRDQKVYANLYLDSITKDVQVEGKGISMYDYIVKMAASNPDMFGNSIVVMCDWEMIQLENEEGKKEMVESLILKSFVSSDLVDDPAATDALFSSNPNDLGVIVTDFLDKNPEIFESIDKNPNIIQDFFERYFNYNQRKSLNTFNMSKTNFFKKLFGDNSGKKFDIDITLADGKIVTVKTDAEQPQVGDEVVDDAGNSVDDDTHLLPDGGSIVTVDGKITEINEATPPADPPAEPTMQEVMQSIQSLGSQFATFSKKIEKSLAETDESLKIVAENQANFQTETKKKFETIKSSYEVPPGEKPEGGKGGAKGYDPEKAKEFREKK
jgi:hypothetical protein